MFKTDGHSDGMCFIGSNSHLLSLPFGPKLVSLIYSHFFLTVLDQVNVDAAVIEDTVDCGEPKVVCIS